MHKIIDSQFAPDLLPLFRKWIETEWGDVNPFENSDLEVAMPAPLLAIDQATLLGGLSFTLFAKPGAEQLAVWINSVFVAPEFRKRGIAGELIKAAERKVQDLGIDELFVFTDIPSLYEKLGWNAIDVVEGSTILSKEL